MARIKELEILRVAIENSPKLHIGSVGKTISSDQCETLLYVPACHSLNIWPDLAHTPLSVQK